MKANYIMINRLIRNILKKCQEITSSAMQMYVGDDEILAVAMPHIRDDLSEIKRIWPTDCDKKAITKAIRETEKSDASVDLVQNYVAEMCDKIDNYYGAIPIGDTKALLLELMHPIIIDSSFNLYNEGNFREAVLNATLALFDYIRKRTKIDKDGQELINEAFSLQNPKLRVSELITESDKSMQKGIIMMLQGIYTGVRNPKAHSIEIEIDKKTASQYLVHISMLAGKVEKAKGIEF